MTDWRGQRRPTPRDGKLRKPNTCPLCGREVIWARVRRNLRGRQGGRAFVTYTLERCPPGTGDMSLTNGLFNPGGWEAPLAEKVAIGTSYRSHPDNCPALQPKTRGTKPAEPAPAFSASSFNKKTRNGGSR